jgi:hypothetical protein
MYLLPSSLSHAISKPDELYDLVTSPRLSYVGVMLRVSTKARYIVA